MTHIPDHENAISRRAFLAGAGVLGLSALSATSPGLPRALAALAKPQDAARALSGTHLVANYLPSQATGWPPYVLAGRRNGVGVTLGGHVPSMQFSFQGRSYEIALLAFGQPGDAPDPIYEPEPSDPTIDFKRTLQKAWGAHYSFRYSGGFTGGTEINVQSYSVLAIEPTATRLSYGGDVFIVYQPDPASTDPAITDDLQWISVAHADGRSFVDGDLNGRANPYYFGSGLTSVYGKQACSFYDGPQAGIARIGSAGPGTLTEDQRMFETFLAQDTGRKDAAGKGIVHIYGGIKWGWQMQPV